MYKECIINKIILVALMTFSFAQELDKTDHIYNSMKARVESSSRSGQKVFWDYFGGETCTFCPAVDMAFDQLLDDYPDDVVLISWADPYWTPYTDNALCIYIDQIGDCHDVRENYYDMTTSRPHYRRQGNQWSSTGGGITSADSAQIYDATIQPATVNALGSETPYEIALNGYRDSLTIFYEITLTMDSYASSENIMLEIVFVEDKVPTWYSGDGLIHNVRNLARHWVNTENVTIQNEGESQIFSGEMLMMDHNLWQISDDDPWNPDNMKLVAIVQDNISGDIHQAMQLNVNDFDIDNDGVGNSDDNCFSIYNPTQEDADGDENGGDACDPCDNANIFLDGNAYGDYWWYGGLDPTFTFKLDIFDIYRLMEVVEADDVESCGYEAGDLTGEGETNIFDVYALIALIMDGEI
tara:strand:- start:911 stop:2143 length:1233 start_codon:yes stop_codon:yes gene_type:complete